MKNLYILICFFTLFLVSCEESAVVNNEIESIVKSENVIIDDNNLPDCIIGIEKGITVTHSPDTIYAQINEKDSSKYIWKHSTIIKSDITDLKIIDFGTYNYKDGKWVLGNKTKKPYTTENFAEWYFVKGDNDVISWENCKDGILKANTEYIDPCNWSITNKELVTRHGLWYYIGIDPMGEKYMGYATYLVMPELKQ